MQRIIHTQMARRNNNTRRPNIRDHWGAWPTHGRCSSFSGVNCGNHRAVTCYECPYYDSRENLGASFCNGDCQWYYNYPAADSYCEPWPN